MAKVSMISGKKPRAMNSRSHALNATKRTQGINLQTIRVNGVRLIATAREIKTLKKYLAKLA